MAEEATQAFVGRMKSDAAFRDRVMGAKDTTERLEIIRAEGFECTEDDIAALARRLEDDEVTHVVGGLNAAGPCMSPIQGLPEGAAGPLGGAAGCGS